MDHAMLNVQEFFQHQVDECLELAKGAVHREDAEFWEESARRWAELAKHKVKRNAALFPIDQPQHTEKLEDLRGDGRRKHPENGTNQIGDESADYPIWVEWL